VNPQHGEAWIRGWYEVICRLPAAWNCDAELVVHPVEPGDDVMLGSYDKVRHRLTVAITPNPYEDLATLLHEVAHAAQIQRHARAHGYSWRRAFAALAGEFLGGDVMPLARQVRQQHGLSRRVALDMAVVRLVTLARPSWRAGLAGIVVGKIPPAISLPSTGAQT
jgi:hypothetical protein